MNWADIKAAWDDAWVAAEAEAVAKYGPAIAAEPMRYAAQVESFVRVLYATRDNLTAAYGRLDALPASDRQADALRVRYGALQHRYNAVASGLWGNSTAAENATETPQAGLAPGVVAVVLGVGLSVAAIAWAVAYREYAVSLQKETALFARDLDARVQASQDGRTLQPATVPRQPPKPEIQHGGAVSSLHLGLVLLTGVVFVGGLAWFEKDFRSSRR